MRRGTRSVPGIAARIPACDSVRHDSVLTYVTSTDAKHPPSMRA